MHHSCAGIVNCCEFSHRKIPGTGQHINRGEIIKSKIAEYSWEEDHRIQQDKTQILHTEENSIIRKLKETVFIKTAEQVISQPSIHVSTIWLPLLQDTK
jgi:hypothetical protein